MKRENESILSITWVFVVTDVLHRSTAISLAFNIERLEYSKVCEGWPPWPRSIGGNVLTTHRHAMMRSASIQALNCLILLHGINATFQWMVDLNHGWSSLWICRPTALHDHSQKGRPQWVNFRSGLTLDDLFKMVINWHSLECRLELEHLVHDNDKWISICW